MTTIVQGGRLNYFQLSKNYRKSELSTEALNVVLDPQSREGMQQTESSLCATRRSVEAVDSRDWNCSPAAAVAARTPSFPTMKRTLALLGLLAIAAAPACTRSANAQSSPTVTDAASAVHVETQAVATRNVPVWLTLTGQLKGSRETELAANANGRVVKTLVERGATVKAGQPIAVIDTRSAALNLAEARASAESAAAAAENAKTTCERYRALAEQGAISQFELDRVSVQCRTSDLTVSAAKARAALAGQVVGDGVIRAPFAGSIAERFVDVGEFVRSDTRVVTLVDLSTLRLEFTIPEASIAVAQVGAKVRFSVAGYPDRKFEGTLKYVSAQVRPATRDIVAEAVVNAPEVALRPGMFASVQLAAGTQSSPIVPRRALVERGGRLVAFVANDGRLEERIVQTGESMGEEVAIQRGVAAGEKLVAAPGSELKNGQRIL